MGLRYFKVIDQWANTGNMGTSSFIYNDPWYVYSTPTAIRVNGELTCLVSVHNTAELIGFAECNSYNNTWTISIPKGRFFVAAVTRFLTIALSY